MLTFFRFIRNIACTLLLTAAAFYLAQALLCAHMMATPAYTNAHDSIDGYWACGVFLYNYFAVIVGVPGLTIFWLVRWCKHDGSAKKPERPLLTFPQFAAVIATTMFIAGALTMYYG